MPTEAAGRVVHGPKFPGRPGPLILWPGPFISRPGPYLRRHYDNCNKLRELKNGLSPIYVILFSVSLLDLKLLSASVHMKGDKCSLYSFNSTLSELSKKPLAASAAGSFVGLQGDKVSLFCLRCTAS